ncbi:MAG: histidine--tRNA ligase [Candidatus Krumholzibacteriia bacterium]
MDLKYRRLKGTRDVLLEEAEQWRWCEERWRETLERYGYGEIRTPIMEPTELFTRSVGEGTDIVDKEMYTFLTKGEESVTLRPEATASVVRAYLENGLMRQPGTLKFYYLGPMFRHDRPQAGRLRQFHQVGVEAIGSASPVLDAEVIRAALALFEAVDAESLTTLVNSIGCPVCRPGYVAGLQTWAAERADRFCATCRARLPVNPLRLFDCKEEACQALLAGYPAIRDSLCGDCAEHDRTVRGTLDDLGVRYTVDPTLVRGLDYYTRTTFEISAVEGRKQSSLCGGGRYDGLIARCGGDPTPAVGFSLGVERTIRHLYAEPVDPQRSRRPGVDVYVVCLGPAAQRYALARVDALRGVCRVEVDCSGRAAKAQMKAADSRRARLVLLAGDEEMAGETLQLKNLESGQQFAIAAGGVLAAVREVLGL